VNFGIVLPAIEKELQLDRHHQAANYAFLDAHVETIAASQVEQWVIEKFEFAKPQ
jgi:prepilin-type processing-associated H-X9-DG protein